MRMRIGSLRALECIRQRDAVGCLRSILSCTGMGWRQGVGDVGYGTRISVQYSQNLVDFDQFYQDSGLDLCNFTPQPPFPG
jgi:hypothetical protein